MLRVVLGDNPCQQVALSRDHSSILIGILMQQLGVALLDEALNLAAELADSLTGDVAVVSKFNVSPRQFFVWPAHEFVFDEFLDLGDANFLSAD